MDDNFSRILADSKSDEATRVMIDKMLLERLALAAIARITGVSERWLQIYVNNNRTYAGTLYIAYCRHKNLHTIISFFQIDITFNVSLNKVTKY